MRAIPFSEDDLILLISNDPNRIAATLEDMFHVHSERYGQSRYCINIKVHSLPLAYNQEAKALANLNDVWELFILPWISDFRRATGYGIYTEGRSGGYMFVDQISEAMEPSDLLEEPEDDQDAAPKVSDWARERLQILLGFKQEWERLLKDIKAWLNAQPTHVDPM